jgi:hypothetical protein
MRALVLGAVFFSLGGLQHASLSLDDSRPPTLTGRHFHAGEHVRVTLIPTSSTRRVTASSSGSFTVRFSSRLAPPCQGWSARAVGDRGSRAILPQRMHPDCLTHAQPAR